MVTYAARRWQVTTGQRYVRNWQAIALRGAAALVFGLLFLIWPRPSLLTLVYIFGIFVLVDGVFSLVSGIRQPEGRGVDWGLVILGLVGIAAGIATFIWPGITGLILLLIIGSWAAALGLVEIIIGFEWRREIPDAWLLILTGIVSVIFGLVVLFAPRIGALALATFIGFFAVVYGVLHLIVAFRLRALQEGQRT